VTPKIYISKLSQETSDQDICAHFSKFGTVVSVLRVKSLDGKKNTDCGYVVMGNVREMNNAINKLNNTKLNGNMIRVIEAHYIDQDNWHPYRSYQPRRRY